MLAAIEKELILRAQELDNQVIETIYFGGGTPSLLSAEELNQIIAIIQHNYKLATDLEITLEANPDDLSKNYLHSLKQNTIINRLSIGLQSLVEADLQFMHRAHNAQEARQCVEWALELGFNLSVDLIYGSPNLSDEDWISNLNFVFANKIPHLSCYALTVEEKTALYFDIKNKKTAPLDEEKAARQFEILLVEIAKNGYEQYEISNFCRPPAYARHNTAYWQGKNYIGIGASAHSFDGQKRRWNIANNALYINNLNNEISYYEEEILSTTDIFNEYLLTSLRTRWGASLEKLATFAEQADSHFFDNVNKWIKAKMIAKSETYIFLTDAGKLLADQIISDLFAA
jgi:oxygen-independent coproporphyrinogen III oxidase